MPTKPIRIYWDSCVYIACIEQEVGRHDIGLLLMAALREAVGEPTKSQQALSEKEVF